jgi:hypothetical protein
MVEGRNFTDQDNENTSPVMIVNQAFVQRFLPGRNPIDGFDLHCVLTHGLNLGEMIAAKVRRAGETNDAFVSVRDLFPSRVF